MLVDNKVEGDSRVQKIARSAAEAGWDVTLLGRSPDGAERSWRLGAAEVRLLPMPEPLHRRRHEFRRSLRWPLAYRSDGIAEHRAQWVRAWRADLAVRAALVTRRAADGELAGARLGRARRALRRREVAARLLDRWVWLRTKMMNRVRYGRRFRSPWDRAYTLFWQLVQGDRAWRRLEPGLWDYELAYGAEVDRLRPDLIHAHDFRMLGVGARAKIRAAGQGRRVALVWDAHEFLPGIKPWRDHARWLPAHRAHEREYAPYADTVLTVSADLAELLRREHRLAEAPGVLLNAPADDHRPADDAPPPDLRAECGIAPDVPLLVYSGAAAPQRGLDTLVEALPRLPGAHLALVVNPALRYVERLAERAARLGVADRLHVLPYVPHWQVVPFLSGADVGVIPIHRWPNHEIALITKFFEYAHARLPVVVSDVRTMAATVRETGQGEVFRAGDVDDLVRAVTAVLADPARHRAAYDRPGLLAAWTWSAQAEVLEAAYRRLLPEVPSPPDTDTPESSTPRGALRCPPQT
ncbi:glycosyltransferase family 4 protein [Micromonospora sp. NPDC005707]|uniref:glycosyltransferase family 4 protein n=1 Tax=Micromonospora sp. NPDC005707 TaxID=3157050 RepID=UPI0033C359E4